jgi:hypothetical protein
MSVRVLIVLVGIGLASVGAGTWAQGQTPQPRVPLPDRERVISGSDLGFRVERQGADGTPIGRLVVRINGQWVEAGFAIGVAKVGTK